MCNKINPKNEKGKITLISRFGHENVGQTSTKINKIYKKRRIKCCLVLRPNVMEIQLKQASGYKTRPFNSVVKEVKNVFELSPKSEGSYCRRSYILK